MISSAKVLALGQNSKPREPSLVDLQNEPLEKRSLFSHRETIFQFVVGTVQRMAGSDSAVAHVASYNGARASRLARAQLPLLLRGTRPQVIEFTAGSDLLSATKQR